MRLSPRLAGRWTGLDGQADGEDGADAVAGLKGQRAIVAADDDVAGDGQALAGSLAHGPGGEEWIKDLVANLLRNSGAGVGGLGFRPSRRSAGWRW